MSDVFTGATMRRRITTMALAGAAAAAGSLTAAQASHAAAWEQISRANGANGAAYFSNKSTPVFASDTGTFALVEKRPALNGFDTSRKNSTLLRNVVSNTTRAVASSTGATVRSFGDEVVRDVSGDEQTLLVSYAYRPTAESAYRYRYVLRPVAGGPDVPLADMELWDETGHDAQLSTDGSTAVITGPSDDFATEGPDSLKVIDVATGTRRVYPHLGYSYLDNYSVSDDGAVIVGHTPWSGTNNGFVIVGGTVRSIPTGASVSPDGSRVIHWADNGNPIVVERLATGVTTSVALPAGLEHKPLWISPDGNRIAFAATAGKQAQILTVSTGTWAKFGRQFSGSLTRTATVSRNGKYAVIEYATNSALFQLDSPPLLPDVVGQAALVDLTGANLPGTTEALSASSYLSIGPPITQCLQGSNVVARYGQPASWAPAPRKGELTATNADGTVLAHKLFTRPLDAVVQFRPSDRTVTFKAVVTDYLGRVLTTEQTLAVQCYHDEP